MQIGVVDYGASNIFSVLRALTFLGADAKIISKRGDFNSVDKIILPGQGSGRMYRKFKKKRTFRKSEKYNIGEAIFRNLFRSTSIILSQ